MSSRIISVSTVLFDGYSMEMAIEEIALAGGLHIEPAFIKGYVDFDETAFGRSEARRLGRMAAKGGLGIHAVSAHLDLSQAGSADALIRRIGFAAEVGASFLITNSGAAQEQDAIRATIEQVLPELEGAGLTLALENPGHGGGNLTGTVLDAANFLRAFGSNNLRLNHDTANVFTYSHGARQPLEDYSAAPEFVAHAHFKDVLTWRNAWVFCALGEGQVSFPNYWNALPEDLPVSIELPLRLERPRGADPIRSDQPVAIENIRRGLASSLAFINQLDALKQDNWV